MTKDQYHNSVRCRIWPVVSPLWDAIPGPNSNAPFALSKQCARKQAELVSPTEGPFYEPGNPALYPFPPGCFLWCHGKLSWTKTMLLTPRLRIRLIAHVYRVLTSKGHCINLILSPATHSSLYTTQYICPIDVARGRDSFILFKATRHSRATTRQSRSSTNDSKVRSKSTIKSMADLFFGR
jgi:hypothetical protein